MRKPKETVQAVRVAAQAIERQLLGRLEHSEDLYCKLMEEVSQLKDQVEAAEASLHFNRMKVAHLEGYIQRVREQENGHAPSDGDLAGAAIKPRVSTGRTHDWRGS